MATRIEQTAIIVLAVYFNEQATNFAQQRS